MQQLIRLLGLPRFSLAGLALAFGLLVVAIGLAIAGVVNLVAALRLAVLPWLGLVYANVLVAVVLLLLAGGLCLVARRLARPLQPTRPPSSGTGDAATVQAIAWMQEHPTQAAILATVLGFCLGASPEARRAVSDLAKPKR